MGGEFCSLVLLLNERFWGCLKSHATISLFNGTYIFRVCVAECALDLHLVDEYQLPAA